MLPDLQKDHSIGSEAFCCLIQKSGNDIETIASSEERLDRLEAAYLRTERAEFDVADVRKVGHNKIQWSGDWVQEIGLDEVNTVRQLLSGDVHRGDLQGGG